VPRPACQERIERGDGVARAEMLQHQAKAAADVDSLVQAHVDQLFVVLLRGGNLRQEARCLGFVADRAQVHPAFPDVPFSQQAGSHLPAGLEQSFLQTVALGGCQPLGGIARDQRQPQLATELHLPHFEQLVILLALAVVLGQRGQGRVRIALGQGGLKMRDFVRRHGRGGGWFREVSGRGLAAPEGRGVRPDRRWWPCPILPHPCWWRSWGGRCRPVGVCRDAVA